MDKKSPEYLKYLEKLTWQESLYTSEMNFKLLKEIAKALDLYPDSNKTRVITIGGTNGKGSCTEMLASVYVNAGYSVGTYTSPHLFKFNERIRIQKIPVSDEVLANAFKVISGATKERTLTYFGFITLAALWIFKQANLQIILLEVGIGGRLDATNIVDADLALITSIGLDHQAYLGNTREAIAEEKAGIFRRNQWIVCGELYPPATLIHAAEALNAQMVSINKDFYIHNIQEKSWSFRSDFKGHSKFDALPKPILSLNNAGCVLQAINILNHVLPIDMNKAIESITQTSLPGRCELRKMPNGINILFDVAHNPQAVGNLANFIKEYKAKKQLKTPKTYAIFSMFSDKDILSTLSDIKNQIDEWHVASINMPRGAPKEQLQKAFEFNNLGFIWHESLEEAYHCLKNKLIQNDLLVVFGSFSVVAEVIASCN